MEAGYSITATKRKARVEVVEEEEEEEVEECSWASHTLRIRKHMQWSSEGLGGEGELEEGKECFFWGGEEGAKGRDGNTSARPGVFPPRFHPASPPLQSSSSSLPPTHLHLWTSGMTRLVCKDSEGDACRRHPLIVVISCEHKKHIGKIVRMSKNLELNSF